MKKYLFLVAAALIAAAALAQDLKVQTEHRPLLKSPETGYVTIADTFALPNLKAEYIYERALMWLAYNTPQNCNVANYANVNTGVIIAPQRTMYKATLGKSNHAGVQEIRYTLTVKVKDGKMLVFADHIRSERMPEYPDMQGWGYAEEWANGHANGVRMPNNTELQRLFNFADRALDVIEKQMLLLANYVERPQTDW